MKFQNSAIKGDFCSFWVKTFFLAGCPPDKSMVQIVTQVRGFSSCNPSSVHLIRQGFLDTLYYKKGIWLEII